MNKLKIVLCGDSSSPNHRPLTTALRLDGANDDIRLVNPSFRPENILNINSRFSMIVLAKNNQYVNNFPPSPPFSIQYIYHSLAILPSSPVLNYNNISSLSNSFDQSGNRFIQWIWQTRRAGEIRNFGLSYTRPNNSSKYDHIACINNGSGNVNGLKMYVNSRDVTSKCFKFSDFHTIDTSYNNLGHILGSFDSTPSFISRSSNSLVDFGICSNELNANDIRRIFNNLGDYGNYPANFMTSRYYHLPFSSGNYDNLGATGLRALDISGNNRHFEITGMGSAATTESVY